VVLGEYEASKNDFGILGRFSGGKFRGGAFFEGVAVCKQGDFYCSEIKKT